MRRAFALALLLVAGLLLRSAGAAGATVRNGELVADGAWCWFQDPRAVHYIGEHDRTYIGYVTSTGDIEVVSQDNGTAALAQATLHVALNADDHAAPGLEVLPNGHIAVFYSGHAGPQMLYRVSTRPEDISAFGPERTVSVVNNGGRGYTYANPIYLSKEKRTYLFFRGGNFKPTVTWSDDGLKTWSPIETIIEPDKPQSNVARPYVQYSTNGVDTISFAFTDGHPRDISTDSVYAMTYKAGKLRTVDGTPLATLGTPATDSPVHTNGLTPLYDGSGPDGEAWVQDMALDGAGNPVVTFASFPTQADHRYHYARWTGDHWTDTEFAAAGGSIDTTGQEPNYSGGISLDQSDPSSLYASRELNGQWEIEHWTTPDNGATFASPAAVTQNSPNKNVRPVVPWGPPGEINVLWMAGQYDHYSASGYHTQIRELTSGLAPTTSRMSLPARDASVGTSSTISARVVQGYRGAPVAGISASLWGHPAGAPYQLIASATADNAGLVHFTVRQSQAMRYQIRTSATADWGSSLSPSGVVNMLTHTAVRISVTPNAVVPRGAVRVGMRVVNAATGHGVPGARPQLWQRTAGKGWRLRGTFTADGHGLASVLSRPTETVTYEARVPDSVGLAASVSSTAQVRMLIPSAARVSAAPATIRPGNAVHVGVRLVNKKTGQALRKAHAQLWQRIGSGSWHYRRTLVTGQDGLAVTITRPTKAITYQARYAGNGRYGASVSGTVHIRLR